MTTNISETDELGKNCPIRGNILVIDDDLETRDMTALMLSIEGFSIRVAKKRETALELIAQCRPDLIVLDWFMPGMSVKEFLLQIQPLGIKVVLVTAGQALAAKADEVGVKHFLPKPFYPDALKNKLVEAMAS